MSKIIPKIKDTSYIARKLLISKICDSEISTTYLKVIICHILNSRFFNLKFYEDLTNLVDIYSYKE